MGVGQEHIVPEERGRGRAAPGSKAASLIPVTLGTWLPSEGQRLPASPAGEQAPW